MIDNQGFRTSSKHLAMQQATGDPSLWVRSVLAIAVVLMCLSASASPAAPAPWVAVAAGGRGFVLTPSGKSFIPWGFNYDRDYKFRLIADYWDADWSTV